MAAAERPRTDAFLAAYRSAFEAADAAVIADLFTFPLQLTSGGAEVEVTSVPSRQAWLPELERLLEAYRKIGVGAAEVVALQTIELTSDLAVAVVRWRLLGEEGGPIYEFDAAYTLVDLGDGFRITAIAHDERPQLRARLAERRGT